MKLNVDLVDLVLLDQKDNMRYLMLLLLALVVTGCANTETDRCRKKDGVTRCEPREPSEPRGRLYN